MSTNENMNDEIDPTQNPEGPAESADEPNDADLSAKESSSGEGESSATDPAADPAAVNPPAGPDEAEVRRELGIGGGADAAIDPSEVERLLEGALEGYGDILAQVDAVSEESAEPAPPVAARIPALGAELIDQNLELLRDVHLQVKVELGRGRMYLKDILRLGQGSVVELERLAGDPLDIYVNDKVIARGEVLVLNESFCIRITEVFNPEELRQAI